MSKAAINGTSGRLRSRGQVCHYSDILVQVNKIISIGNWLLHENCLPLIGAQKQIMSYLCFGPIRTRSNR